MATVMDYALMADSVYDEDPAVDGWKRVAFRPSGVGLWEAFQGAAFSSGGELVFAFKGTSGGRDVIADAKLAVGMNTHQYGLAWDFVMENLQSSGAVTSICGHSLGGAIAQIIGNRARLPFMTFNAPGVGLFSRNLDEMAVTVGLGTAALRTAGAMASAFMHPMQAARDAASVFNVVTGINFRVGKDVVGCTGVHYGDVIEIPYGGGSLDVMTKHKMATMIAALEGSDYGSMPMSALV